MSFTGGGTRRWMSPELLDPQRFKMPGREGNRPTRQSDCYALGMVVYEVGVYTNSLPRIAYKQYPRYCADTIPILSFRQIF